jgi:hypothetical protein
MENTFVAFLDISGFKTSADPETRKFLRYWFDDYACRQLAALAIVIGRVRNESIRDVLWCAFHDSLLPS